MEKYSLIQIRKYAQKLAEVISEVLRVDVEIVDNNLIRIAGTGRYKKEDCISIEGEGFVYKKVINTGKKQVIENPGFNKLCAQCSKRNSCFEKFECCTPIVIEKRVIGVISLICFTDTQKKIIIDKFKEYLDFLDKMSELIAIKAKENYTETQTRVLVEELQSIINYIRENVIVVDNDFNIIFANNQFISLLKNGFGVGSINNIKIKITDYLSKINNDNSTLFTIEINGITRRVMGYINEINSTGNRKSKVVIFQDMKTVNKTIYEHSQANKTVLFDSIVGNSKEFIKVKEEAKRIARGSASVLIIGESGTGKELFARAIHNESPRGNNPFIAINCGAIPETLLESELFGYVPGAFSGASRSGKIGKFELASKGTIFLDEIGDMPLHLQVKLLRVLQDKVVIPIGSNKPIPVNVRVISATNKNLLKMVKNNEFREDLYYRLNVIPIEIPPLRKRKDDIELLIDYFLFNHCSYYEMKVPAMTKETMDILGDYSWPGNIRELENTMEYIINIANEGDKIDLKYLPSRIWSDEENEERIDEYNLEKIEKYTIKKALERYGSTTEDKKHVAKVLGIGLSTLYRKIEKYSL